MVSTNKDGEFWKEEKDQWEKYVIELEKEAQVSKVWFLFERFTTVIFVFSTGYFLYHAMRFFNQ